MLNFGKPFKVRDMSIEEAMEHFMEIQRNALDELKINKMQLLEHIEIR